MLILSGVQSNAIKFLLAFCFYYLNNCVQFYFVSYSMRLGIERKADFKKNNIGEDEERNKKDILLYGL